jgi:hypothetical protein
MAAIWIEDELCFDDEERTGEQAMMECQRCGGSRMPDYEVLDFERSN